jgi:hypothetical protein
LTTPDPDLTKYKPVREWLQKVELIVRTVFNSSNLYNMAPQMIGETVQFGTGFMTHIDDFENVAHFQTHTIGSYMLAEDEKGHVCTAAREYQRTVKQIVDEFGKQNCSEAVKNQYDQGNYDMYFPVCHMIDKNPEYDPAKVTSKYKAYRSIYWEPGIQANNVDADRYLSHKGFDEFPGYALRWETTDGDVYGTDCPGMTALGDVKGLQLEEREKAKAIQKMVSPPLKGPSTIRGAVNGLAGGLTLYDQGQGDKDGLKPIYEVKPQLQELKEDILHVEQRLNEAYHVPLFLAITNMEGIQPRNEFELMQRNQERLLMLGPVLEQFHGEFLDRLLNRTLKQCFKARILPPPPQELVGKDLVPEYVSTLAQAQRAVAAGAIDRLAAFAGGLKGAMLSDGRKFNGDKAIERMAIIIGAPAELVNSDDEVEAQRQQEAQAMQAAQTAEIANQGAQAAKAASDAKTSDPSVLTRITGQDDVE